MRSLAYLKEHFAHASKPRKFLVIISLALLFGASIYGGYLYGSKKLLSNKDAVSPKGTLLTGTPEEPRNFPNPINGVLFKKSEAETWVNRLPLGVIIENHTAARPQSGLSRADVVYEALAEGGITRFLAIFLQEDSDLGPVRSNRPYYIDWLSEYDAAYAHVGGSPEGQSRVKSYKIKDLDQFSIGAPTYTRSSKRSAPHNVYTSTQKLRTAAQKKGYKKGAEIVSWKFTDSEPKREERPASQVIKLGFLGTRGYSVEWRYNPDTNSYFRFHDGVAHKDSVTKAQLEVKTLVVQTVRKYPDPSGKSRLFMDTIGSGVARVFINGTMVVGSWKKDSRTSRTLFYDGNGAEIKFNRGKIWIDIIPPESKNSYT